MSQEREVDRDRFSRRGDRRDPLDDEDVTQLDRLWGKAKGFASRKKTLLPTARYSSSKNDDGGELELLENIDPAPRRIDPAPRLNGFRSTSSNKGIFDDI